MVGWLCACVLVLACAAEGTSGASPAEASLSPSAAGAPATAPYRFDVCPTPLGTAEELALTPRADTNLELLALSLDEGHLTATQPTYERVVADIGTLRTLAPSLAMVAFWPPHDGHSLLLTFGSDGTEAWGAGEYTAWDCLIEAYRAEVGSVVDVFPTYAPTIFLDGIFDLPQMVQLFMQLPDVGAQIYESEPGRTLCATREGERYQYVVDGTNGSCSSAAGCRGSARHFASDAPGQVEVLETWTAADDSPAPGWFRDVCE